MIVEFTAIRLVSPFFGSSMDIWATIIAVIMAAMALGYFFGGYISQKTKKLSVAIYITICLAGLLIGISYFLVEPIVTFTSVSLQLVKFSLSLKTFLVVLTLFFLPVFLLGSIYPMIVASLKNQKSGQASGFVFALSTVGSIFGSLLPSFILIPLIGTKLTFFLTGVLLEIIAFFGLPKWLKIFPFSVFVFFFIVLSPPSFKANIPPQSNILYQTESIYQKVKVIKDNQNYTLSLGENDYVSSYYSPDSFTGTFYDYFSLLPLIRKFNRNLDVLIIGLGGGTISRQYQHFYSKSYFLTIDGVEIDSEVIKVGKMFFELEQPNLKIYQMDGRVFLNQSRKKYDIIIIDAYARQSYIPFHLATQEFLKTINNNLKENGILAFNVGASSTLDFRFQAISNTVKSIFKNSYYFSPGAKDNIMIFASPTDFISFFDYSQQVVPQELEPALKKLKNIQPRLIQNINTRFLLKDDTAPEKI